MDLKCRVFGGITSPMAIVRVLVWLNMLQQFSSGQSSNLDPFYYVWTIANRRQQQPTHHIFGNSTTRTFDQDSTINPIHSSNEAHCRAFSIWCKSLVHTRQHIVWSVAGTSIPTAVRKSNQEPNGKCNMWARISYVAKLSKLDNFTCHNHDQCTAPP